MVFGRRRCVLAVATRRAAGRGRRRSSRRESSGRGIRFRHAVVATRIHSWTQRASNSSRLVVNGPRCSAPTAWWWSTPLNSHLLPRAGSVCSIAIGWFTRCDSATTEAAVEIWTLADWCDQCHRKGGLCLAQKFCGNVLLDATEGTRWGGGETLAEMILGKIDAMDVFPVDPAPRSPTGLANSLLNIGFPHSSCGREWEATATCGLLGSYRTYARLSAGQELSYKNWIEAVRGRANLRHERPHPSFTVDGHEPGAAFSTSPPSPPPFTSARRPAACDLWTPWKLSPMGRSSPAGDHDRVGPLRPLSKWTLRWPAPGLAGRPHAVAEQRTLHGEANSRSSLILRQYTFRSRPEAPAGRSHRSRRSSPCWTPCSIGSPKKPAARTSPTPAPYAAFSGGRQEFLHRSSLTDSGCRDAQRTRYPNAPLARRGCSPQTAIPPLPAPNL